MTRSSGILAHPSSLPGPYGIGDLGRTSFDFVDWIAAAGQKLWQVLPLGPTGYGDSPYASFSTFAGNPLLIGFDALIDSGYLSRSDLFDSPAFSADSVEYGKVIPWKFEKLDLAADRFLSSPDVQKLDEFQAFTSDEAWWLDDYVLFMDIKADQDERARRLGIDGAMWSNFWPRSLALRDETAIRKWMDDPVNRSSMERRKAVQFFFFDQWKALKRYANQKGVSIIGDLPIFVAHDSVDVWAHRDLFQLDEAGSPVKVAGVPPDYFSATGQLWGNPLYDWKRHENDGFVWWIKRIKANLLLFDRLRIDHFRGFESYWAVPYGNATAEYGSWEKAPGAAFFSMLKRDLGDIPILAEDLGFITDEVRSLRDSFSLPGMKILQFAFDASEGGNGLDVLNGFLPHMYTPNCVVYTGTHDNDTLKGWLDKARKEEIRFIRSYIGRSSHNLVDELIRLALSSVAVFALIPLQDIFNLGSEARMNTPSTVGGNWKWRARKELFTDTIAAELKKKTVIYAR